MAWMCFILDRKKSHEKISLTIWLSRWVLIKSIFHSKSVDHSGWPDNHVSPKRTIKIKIRIFLFINLAGNLVGTIFNRFVWVIFLTFFADEVKKITSGGFQRIKIWVELRGKGLEARFYFIFQSSLGQVKLLQPNFGQIQQNIMPFHSFLWFFKNVFLNIKDL